MNRVVIDTNVIVSAFLLKGRSARSILRLCFSGQVKPIVGNALFLEYEEVAGRQKLFAKSPLSKLERQQFLDDFLSLCEWIPIYYLWRPNLKDEADNHIMELAVAGMADTIFTSNIKDFQHMQLLFPNVSITTPYNYLHAKES